jgi:hypothetical protein
MCCSRCCDLGGFKGVGSLILLYPSLTVIQLAQLPPMATLEDIKAYQAKVEKNKITPNNLPPYPRCSVESQFFKIHAYRERRFLIIIEMLIKAAYCSLVRFR